MAPWRAALSLRALSHAADLVSLDRDQQPGLAAPADLNGYIDNGKLVLRWVPPTGNLQYISVWVNGAASDVLDEAETYLGERRRTMIFAVRDRLRGEERHLASTRERLLIQGRHLVESATRMLASNRQLLSAYDPTRRLAQGWSIVTNAQGVVVKSLDDVALDDVVNVLVSDGNFTSKVIASKGTSK